MNDVNPNLGDLFAQLGLPDSPADIGHFVEAHRPLDPTVRLSDAQFWSQSQSELLKQKYREDGEWTVLIETLSAMMRAQPDSSDDGSAIEGEGSITAARRYGQSARAFQSAGKVDAAAKAAQPRTPREAQARMAAEEQGRAHAKT